MATKLIEKTVKLEFLIEVEEGETDRTIKEEITKVIIHDVNGVFEIPLDSEVSIEIE